MRRLLVTGAAGFVGSSFVRHWLERHPEDHVVALDLLTYAGDRRNLEGLDVRLVVGDIGDLELVEGVLAEEDVDVVVNFAAESHNSLAVLEPGRFFRTNVLGTQALLEAARRRGVARFHHVSTCEVYGDLPLDSGSAFGEGSPYRPLPLYASDDSRREWLHVDDRCEAVELVLLEGRVGETYNVGSGDERSIEAIAGLVLELTGKPESLKTTVPDRPGHDRRFLLDSSKLRRELGWLPRIPFEDGLRATAGWYAANREWWEPLRERAPVAETTAWA